MSSDRNNNSNNHEQDAKFLDLHSRQIGTYGLETMMRLVSLKVLILGCGGVGVEAAKNLSLAGVHTISVFDNRIPTAADQGVNFALKDSDIEAKNVTLAQASARLLHDLNPAVRIRVVAEQDDKIVGTELVQQHDCVIVTASYSDLSIKELCRINDACRSRKPAPASFLLALTGGHFATVFADHGDNFVTRDLDGRPSIQKVIVGVQERVDRKGKKYSLVRYETPEGMLPGALRDYTHITFSGVRGLTNPADQGKSVNDCPDGFAGIIGTSDPKNSVRVYPSLVEQGFTTPYHGGGFITEVKEQVVTSFYPLAKALRYAHQVETDPLDWTLNNRTHAALASVLLFASTNSSHKIGALPRVHNDEDAEQALNLFKEWNAEGKKICEEDAEKDKKRREHDEHEEEAKHKSAALSEESSEADKPDPDMPGKPPAPRAPNAFCLDESDEDSFPAAFIKRTARVISVELQPMAAFIGAVVAQEVVKVTGKFTPINQFLSFDYSPALPNDEELQKLQAAGELAPRGDRYDNLTRLMGRTFTDKLQALKVFMPGCGALGCEYMKNFALLGMCNGSKGGKLTVTDNDRIEVSNLSRQFLFREDNVGQPKSVAAGKRVKDMNGAMNVDARQDFVGSTTEKIFDDAFWDSLDCVINALDNMPTRIYVDGKCVFHRKVLVEAGTTGTAGNVDIVNPGKTTSYSDGGKADETGGIPMCTLRNFPYIYEHCIEWARAQFNEAFVTPLSLTQQIREDPARFVSKLKADIDSQSADGAKLSMYEKNIKNLSHVQALITSLTSEPPSIELCARLAWKLFHEQFRDRIVALCQAFPKDARKKNGEHFWSGHRHFPTPLSGDALAVDEDVREFMISATNLFASMFGIHGEKPAPRFNDAKQRWMAQYRTKEWISGVVANLGGVPVPEKVDVEDLDDESKADRQAGGNGSNKEVAKDLTLDEARAKFNELVDSLVKGVTEIPASAAALEFEKDDDDNFHIDFVTAASNLRAKNYEIATKDRLSVKLIAGKIIPAIATTTAAVCGLGLLEYFKVLLGRGIQDLRNGQIDLGCNTYMLFERDPPAENKTRVEKQYYPEHDYTEEKEIRCVPDKFTKYDRLEFPVTRATAMGEFIDRYQDVLKDLGCPVMVSSVAAGEGLLWSMGAGKHANHDKPLLALLAEKVGNGKSVDEFWQGKLYYTGLVPHPIPDEGDDVETPTVVLVLPKQQ